MQLDRIGLQLRRRSAWEALDLGHALLRAWALPAYRVWLISFWGCGLLLTALLWQWPGWAVFVLWWLKPLFDRLLLFTYSRALFGNPVRLIDVWRELPRLLQHSGLIAGLFWRRLSTVRSLVLPVWQLEGQTGQAARARARLLARRTGGYAVWLTFVCANLVGILWIAGIMTLEVLLPVGSEGIFQWSDWWENTLPPWKEMIANVLWMLAETLIEPFYVASGFSLYLNRRSELEGWDIELGFRRLADRVRETGAHTLSGCVLAVLLGGSLFATSPPAAAEPSERAKPVIQEVLKDPVFGNKIEEKEWQWRQSADQAEEKRKPDWFDRFMRIFELLSEALRGLLWVIAALIAVALLSIVIRYRDRWLPRRAGRAPPPDFLFGLDVRPDSLPGDVVAAARAHFTAGRCREGLSLLYRGALIALIHRLHVEFRAGDTEGDCLRRVCGKLDAAAESYFADLLAVWQSTAYAEHTPTAEALEDLCRAWANHFAEEATQ